jgi:hypothetical protein
MMARYRVRLWASVPVLWDLIVNADTAEEAAAIALKEPYADPTDRDPRIESNQWNGPTDGMTFDWEADFNVQVVEGTPESAE